MHSLYWSKRIRFMRCGYSCGKQVFLCLEFQVFFLNLLISRHGISNVILGFTAYIKYGTPCLKCFVHGALYFMHTVCTWGFNEFVQTGFSPFSNLFDRKSLVGFLNDPAKIYGLNILLKSDLLPSFQFSARRI